MEVLFPCSVLPDGNAVVLYSKAYGFLFFFFFASLEECALINMGEGIYGQVQEITFYFYENNALHQLDLRGLSAEGSVKLHLMIELWMTLNSL